jgi:hypothetical protein
LILATQFRLIPLHAISLIEPAATSEPGRIKIDLINGDTVWIDDMDYPDLARILGDALNNNVKFLDLNEDEIPF